MSPSKIIEDIKIMFDKVGSSINIPLLNGGWLEAELMENGIKVGNQVNKNLLPWSAFIEVVNLLAGGRGDDAPENGTSNNQSSSGLYITDIHGVAAYVVFGARLKHSVYKQVAQIIAVLIWAKICRFQSGFLILNQTNHIYKDI